MIIHEFGCKDTKKFPYYETFWQKNAKLSHNWTIFIKFSPAINHSGAESSIRALPVQLAAGVL